MDGKVLLGIIVVFVIIVSIIVNARSLPNAQDPPSSVVPVNYGIVSPEDATRRLLATPKHTGRFMSKGEAECRRVLERIYSVPFPTVHPEWLRNPESGRKLEIDCYAEIPARRLGLGFEGNVEIGCEYNGEHHDSEYMQWNDEFKRQVCEAKGVHLITVPYTVKLTQIRAYITQELDARSLLPRY
jgi:hypothetical protein